MDETPERYQKCKSSSFHGSAYELYLHMVYILKCIENNYSFKLSTQSIDAEKFDDVVIEIKDTIGNHYCRFLQAKHTRCDNNQITYDMLIANKNTQFNLSKYLISYLNIIERLRSQNKELYDLIIFTNKSVSTKMEKENFVECDDDEEPVLNFPQCYDEGIIKRSPKRLRLNETGKSVFSMLKETYLKYVVARTLVKSFKQKQIINITDDLYANNYLKGLDMFEEILRNSDIVCVKFKLKFFENSKTGEFKDLRTMFFELHENKPIDDISVESLKAHFKNEIFAVHSDCLGNCNESTNNQIEWPDNYLGNVKIKDFLRKLKFYVNQPNHLELADYIKRSKDILIDNDFIDRISLTDCLIHLVTRWMATEGGEYITDKTVKSFFCKMNSQVSNFILTQSSNHYCCQLQNYNVVFENYCLEHFRKISLDKTKICIETDSELITVIKLQQFFNQELVCKKTVIFLNPNCEDFFQKNVVNVLNNCEIFLIVTLNDANKRFAESLLTNDLFNGIIMINKSSKFRRKFEQISSMIDNDVTINELTEESKNLILNTERMVTFQGQEILLQNLPLNTETISCVNGKYLSMLINDKLRIGNDIPIMKDVMKYYIERKYLKKTVYLKPNFKNETETFYVTNSLSERKWKKANFQEKDIVIIVEDDVDFNRLNYVTDNNIHLVQNKHNKYIWKGTKNKLTNLRKYFDKIDSNVELKICDKFVILAAEPGMGKTTLFSHLMHTIKQEDPLLWMIKINLIEHTKLLKKYNFDEDYEVINFLCEATKITEPFEKNLFEESITNHEKVIIFLDGYDEIDTQSRENVVKLIKRIQINLKVKQLWISTRLHFKTNLEDLFGQISYDLKDLTEKEQESFLIKYWQQNDDDVDNYDYYEAKARNVIELINKSITVQERQFMGIPLQTRMVAEIYDNDKELPNVIDMLILYNEFIEKKFEVFLKDKLGVTNIGLHTDDMLEKYRPDFDYSCKLLAIKILYPDKADLWLQYFPDPNLSIEKFTLTGFIGDIVNGLPQFVHRTFAEYFASKWFLDNYHRVFINNYIKENFFRPHFHVVRHFFERMLLEIDNDKVMMLHRYILNNDHFHMEKYLENFEYEEVYELLNSKDKAGRTPLHLACSYNLWLVVSYLLNYCANTKICDDLFDWYPINYVTDNKNEDNEDIIEKLSFIDKDGD